jgi:hypothetical protein
MLHTPNILDHQDSKNQQAPVIQLIKPRELHTAALSDQVYFGKAKRYSGIRTIESCYP